MIITRRDYPNRCYHYKAIELDEELAYSDEPSGIFFAKQNNVIAHTDNTDGGIVDIDQQMVIIETKDDVSNIAHKDIVVWLDEKWIVENIQSQVIAKGSKYRRKPDRIWWLTLRNGKDS